jgi:hypothetical protein
MGEHEVVATTEIVREKGFLYVCKGSPISIIKIPAGRKKKVVQDEVKEQPEVTQENAQEVTA